MGVDPDFGEELAIDAHDGRRGEFSDDTDPHLLLYSILRDEIRDRISVHHRSLLTGLSVIGLVIAYALLSGEFVFLAVIPVVIGFLVVQTARQLNRILFIARQLGRIERTYVDDYPLFVWEHRYGMVGTDNGVQRWQVNWTLVPQSIILALATLGYVASIYATYVVWPPEGVDILAIGLDRSGLLVIYSLLTILVCLAGYSYYLHQVELSSSDA